MRGIFALVLVAAFATVFVGTLLRFSSIEQANEAVIWYIKTKGDEYLRRDFELSLRKAMEYAAHSCYPPTNQCVEESAKEWLSKLKNAWGSLGYVFSIDPDAVTASVFTDTEGKVYTVTVSITKPIYGQIGDVRLYIPSGFSVTEVIA